MSQIQQSDVDVPVSVAYNQWTQFESFPHFMSGVESITQVDDTRNHWVTNIAGVKREFDTEITEQHPDERVAWRSVGGDAEHAGVVTFHRLGDTSTRVMIQIDWQPSGVVEKVGSAINVDDLQVKRDAQRFKEFIESRVRRPAPGAATSRLGNKSRAPSGRLISRGSPRPNSAEGATFFGEQIVGHSTDVGYDPDPEPRVAWHRPREHGAAPSTRTAIRRPRAGPAQTQASLHRGVVRVGPGIDAARFYRSALGMEELPARLTSLSLGPTSGSVPLRSMS